MKKIKFILLVLFCSSVASFSQAKTILITDIDDTLKVAHAIDLVEAATYIADAESRFLGMSEVLKIAKLHNPALDITYLTKGPSIIVSEDHRNFLKNGQFPKGTYIARTNIPPETHKLVNIRRILQEQKPDQVIFIGDNGEQDPPTYHQIVQENSKSQIKFLTLIHVVYSTHGKKDVATPLFPEQIGFVSSLEVGLEFLRNNYVSEENARELIRVMAPILADEENNKATGELVFPYFMDCSDFVWRWNQELKTFKDLAPAYKKLRKKCG